MKQRFFTITALLIFCLLHQVALGQFEEGVPTVSGKKLTGVAIAKTATNTVTYSAVQGQQDRKIKNVVSLSINESDPTYLATAFTIKVPMTIVAWKKANGTPELALQQVLQVSYDPATGAKFDTRSTYAPQEQYEQLQITIDDVQITGSTGSFNPLLLVDLVNEMRITRYYQLAYDVNALTPIFNAAVNNADAIALSWTWPVSPFNNITQLEWSWVEDDMAGYYMQNGILNADFLFQVNSVRVDLDYGVNAYKVPLLYPGPGKLYYRVRPAMRKNDETIVTGPWSAVQNASFGGHGPDLNWQSSTSFAENGKSKTVIQYFDGSLRNRQTVTKDNETGNTIVGETIYDLQGRPNIQILPTPTISQTIQYFSDFNRFNGQANAMDNPARFFDLTPAGLQCNAAPAMDTSMGNGRYYSANNDWLAGANAENKSKFIPSSFGYAYTETRFTDDATERVSSQGGVGPNHRIGSGHETKYFYGKPNQQELDALFATEVGDASHYSKNMVQDANGQMSVSYVDMHGRTIATALAGDPPSNLLSIVNTTDYPQATTNLTNRLLTVTNNIIKGNSIECINTILTPVATPYTFTYKLDPAIFSKYGEGINKQVCFDCKYDLEISIRPEDCSNTTPIIKRYSNLRIVPEDQACGMPMGFVGEGITTPTTMISFTQTLATGSWVVRKTLYINDSLFAIRKDSALKAFLVKTQQNIYDSVFAAKSTQSGCNLPVKNTANCDSCNAHLGAYSDYEKNYLADIGNPIGYDVNIIKAQFAKEQQACAEACGPSHNQQLNTLASLRSRILADMYPNTGQYAIEAIHTINQVTGEETITPITSSNIQAQYNIFSNNSLLPGRTVPYFRIPRDEQGNPSNYFTADNKIDNNLLDESGTSSLLPTITNDDFAKLFQPSWANRLIYYHPEFKKLKYAEDHLSDIYTWLDNVQFTETYATALKLHYLDPINSDPYFTRTDLGHNDKGAMQQYLSSFISNGSNDNQTPSIWQLANSSVLCSDKSDLEKKSCIIATRRDGLDTRITSESDKNTVWESFRGTYLSYRNEMLVNYLNGIPEVQASLSTKTMNSLVDDGKQLLFANMQTQANQSGSAVGTLWAKAASVKKPEDTTGLGALSNAALAKQGIKQDYCNAQKPLWRSMLLQCEQLTSMINRNAPGDVDKVNAIINTILDGLITVCQNSQTSTNPYGATNTATSYTGSTKSFEEVVNKVFVDNGIATNIADSNYYCNPFSIDAPKPYGKSRALFTNYNNKIDTCNCSRFATLKQEASSLGFNTTTMAGMNKFLAANYQDTLSSVVWQGLQRCGNFYVDTCTYNSCTSCLTRLAANADVSATVPKNNNCFIYQPIQLTGFVAIPSFLNCDYQKPCLSCGMLNSYTQEFKNKYPFYAEVPYQADDITKAQINRNSLWARFLNYRTGFSLSSSDYMTAINNCKGSGNSTVIGYGQDCGPNSAVDTLWVNAGQGNNDLYARRSIIFQGDYSSADGAVFTASLDTVLQTCNNNTGIAGTIIGGGISNNAYVLCASSKPLNDVASLYPKDTVPCRQAQTDAGITAQMLFSKLKDSLTANFDSLYLAKCLVVQSTEQFYATYIPREYHYTLYYYDQAGNLLKTLPPAAVKPNYDLNWLADVALKRLTGQDVQSPNNELLATNYRYNTLNQVISQNTPDAHASSFWYDRLGRLSVSQNAQQQTTNAYSYTKYDLLGRIKEVGQLTQANAMQQSISQDETGLTNWMTAASNSREQITLTVYDQPYKALQNTTEIQGQLFTGLYQQNLRNRVSFTQVFASAAQKQLLSDGNFKGANAATYYTYDIHGNVDTLVQDATNMGSSNRFKRMVYNYDLISGKVNFVSYQPGYKDQFYHRYEYDAENRLTKVYTSKDSLFWDRDASYDYYRHGPLARTVLGQNQVQGVDYAYTLQGWLKGMNSTSVGNAVFDMGADGKVNGSNSLVARDAYGFGIGYYAGDYNSVGNSINGFQRPFSEMVPIGVIPDIFNGNIKSTVVNILQLNQPIGYGYHYDQLNRLRQVFTSTAFNNTTNVFAPGLSGIYNELITYDPNGNIETDVRQTSFKNGTAGIQMDYLTYQYEKSSSGALVSNKLRYVYDGAAAFISPNDIDNQTTLTLEQVQAEKSKSLLSDNYQYDAIGNLIKDVKEGISNIKWTVYGKIQSISKTDGTTISYSYDASGNRISKTITSTSGVGVGGLGVTTFYVRDASGNTMSIYNNGNVTANSGHLTQAETHLYGSSRLGIVQQNTDMEVNNSTAMVTFTRGNKFFELTNHLGNVLVTVSDKHIGHDAGNGTIDYYNADVLTAQDYYAFGMQMPGRSYNQPSSSYRYGFNGKENDNEVKGQGNSIDYGARVYDPRLGRFLSVDPLQKQFPWLTPYQYAGNSPIRFIDLDGLEPLDYSYHWQGSTEVATKWVYTVKNVYDNWTKQTWTVMQYPNDNRIYYWKPYDGSHTTFNETTAKSQGLWNGQWQRFETQETIQANLGYKVANGIGGFFAGAIAAGALAEFAIGATPILADVTANFAANLMARTYPYIPIVAGLGNKAAEILDESGSLQGANSGVTFKATEILTRSFAHIFSSKHLKVGLAMFGKDEGEILRKIEGIVGNNIDNLKEGDNFIETTINGVKGTVKAFVKDNDIQSVNAVQGTYTRQYNNVIKDVNSE